MKWTGDKPLVIGLVDEAGVKEEVIIEPGAELTPRALELLKLAESQGGAIDVPYDNVYSRKRVEAAHKWEHAKKGGPP